jgi:rhodanese-related sulfurtransferase
MFGFFHPGVPTVTVEALKNAIDAKESMRIIDVRSDSEYTRAHIKNSTNIPVDELAEKIMKACPNKNEKIYVYCMSGSRSIVAVDTMIKLGYTNVFDVSHGLLAWRIQKYPLEQ